MDRIDGQYLKDLRKQYGYSLRTFAQKIYVSKSSVQRWEQTAVPEFDDIREKIADVFNVSVEEMCRQSALKYGENKAANKAAADGELSNEKLAELKFGTKWVIYPIVLLSIFAIISICTFLS